MNRIDLNGLWHMTGNGFDVTGTVPGSVYSFLIDGGLAPDPYYRDNEKIFFELSEHEYSFERKFDFEKSGCAVLLCCDGLDTLCDIYVNGEHVAYTDNMHVSYEFDITDRLVDGENTLKFDFHPVNPYIKAKHKENPIPISWDAMVGYPHIRKAHCMLGWDWGTRLPDAGIFRDIYLLEKNSARIEGVKIDQRHADGRVFITPKVKTDMPCGVRVTLTAPTGEKVKLEANAETEIKDPMLWWPNGLGQQNLYTAEVEIVENGVTVDKKEKRIGLRTYELIREKDKWGESFYQKVNGVAYFAVGANYVPMDNILSRVTAERTYNMLKQCRDCNFNTVRVWGGGYYPDDFFFDACDELGLAVCFDLMFACSTYDPDEHMRASIMTEIRQNVTRICDRACLSLISGNNEVEMIMARPHENWNTEHLRKVYLDMFEDEIPELIKSIAPEVAYISSSPTTCGHLIDPINENYGNQHYYGVWNGGLPATEYRNKYCRYLSEFGFQSMADYKTVKSFTEEEDRNLNSRIMDVHERSRGAHGKILTYMTNNFKYSSDFKTLIYATQLLQADTVRIGVEHFRRNRGRCMGTLYWQLNDIWPVTSWAGMDYYGRYKALQYCTRRFYSPVMISCLEVGEVTGRPHPQCEYGYYDYTTTATLSVNNETREAVCGKVRWALRDNNSAVIESGEQDVEIAPMSVLTLDTLDFGKTDLRNHVEYSFEVGGKTVSYGTVIFTAYKHYDWVDPGLSVALEGDEIVVKSEAYAKYVDVYSEDSDFILSDNFFDMEKGERRIRVLEGTPKNLRVRSVYDIR